MGPSRSPHVLRGARPRQAEAGPAGVSVARGRESEGFAILPRGHEGRAYVYGMGESLALIPTLNLCFPSLRLLVGGGPLWSMLGGKGGGKSRAAATTIRGRSRWDPSFPLVSPTHMRETRASFFPTPCAPDSSTPHHLIRSFLPSPALPILSSVYCPTLRVPPPLPFPPFLPPSDGLKQQPLIVVGSYVDVGRQSAVTRSHGRSGSAEFQFSCGAR
ncbi:hypothetical protein H6P81_008588 [Aristolochia fimbriata]|uniref:Uncharacterized protein n=1 Tax=Aristolochia fimbriata TaxID=158543 RepID=A0AAV7EN19_ARIFI|nr:hypothetical protein H6P81_008588 [Aristolochia fimbriata]